MSNEITDLPNEAAFERSVDGLLLDQFGIEDSVQTHVEMHDGDAGMPQLDTDSFAGQIFWLIVSFVLLYILISKSALPRIHEVIDKRKHRIERDLDRADMLSEEADTARAKYEKLQQQARDKSAALIDKANASIAKAQAQESARADEEIHGLMQQSEKDLAEKQASFSSQLTELSHTLATSLVHEITGKSPAKSDVSAALSSHG